LRDATTPGAEALIIVFARAPVAGRVKTRLARALGARPVARLHERLVERAVATAVGARAGVVELHCAPDARHPFLRRLAARYGVRARGQPRGNLGARMHGALDAALRTAPVALLIGSDCPALRSADLRAAVRALRDGEDAVFSPARDGGYALVGLRRSAARLFGDIPWGGSGVMRATRERLRQLGWSWRELRSVWDVDRPPDYARLRRTRLLRRAP
jgi:rSAM/selenodomain-associated transferase 1